EVGVGVGLRHASRPLLKPPTYRVWVGQPCLDLRLDHEVPPIAGMELAHRSSKPRRYPAQKAPRGVCGISYTADSCPSQAASNADTYMTWSNRITRHTGS